MKKILKRNLLLFLIILLAFILRVFQLGTVPYGLHADEASFLVNTKAILQTGKDEDSSVLPLSFSSIIDPKPALYSYFQAPCVWIFGQTTFASRLPSVFLGLGSILLAFLILKEFNQEKTGVVLTILLAVSPWHIIVSRSTQEVISSYFFLSFSILMLIKLLKDQKKVWIVWFFISTVLSMYFYHSVKVILPLVAISYVFVWANFSKKKLLQYKKIFLVTLLSFFLSFFVISSKDRVMAIGLLSDDKIFASVVEQIYCASADVPQLLLRLYYNKPLSILKEFSAQYFSHLDPVFLFISSGEPKRYLIPNHGLLYIFEFIFFGSGIFFSLKNKSNKQNIFFILILLFSPIPAALTTHETPSIIRIFPLVLSLLYFVAVGIISLYERIRFKLGYLFFVGFLYLFFFTHFWIQYSVQQKRFQPWYRNDTYSRIAQEVKLIEDDYESIQTTNDLRPLYLYFVLEDLISIDQLQKQPHARDSEEYSLGKYTFNRGSCQFDSIDEGVLYIAETRCKDENRDFNELSIVKTISYLDGVPVYNLLEKKSANE